MGRSSQAVALVRNAGWKLGYLAESDIGHVADVPMDDRPFDIRAKRATLASIPYRVEPNAIATMLIHHHEAAQ